MTNREANLLTTAAGGFLMLFALTGCFIAVPGSYRGVLLGNLGFAVAAVCVLAVPLARGPRGWRVAAVILAAPGLFVLFDFASRAPHVFWGQ